MSIGLSPNYEIELHLQNTTPEQFLVVAIEAAKRKEWSIGYTSETGFIAYTRKSFSSYGEEVRITIDDNLAVIKSTCTGNQMVDWGKNKKNVEQFVETYDELRATLSDEELAEKYDELKATLVTKEDDELSKAPPSTKEKVESFTAIFKPVKGYFITPIIIDLNIAIFILMVISGVNFLLPDNESLLRWGANFRPSTLDGEWWRLITNCFLHIGIMHLLLNMYALLYIGVLLEPHLGKTRFLAAYLLTGMMASLTSLFWHDLTISAGASGAIFGLYGVFLAMLTTNFIEKAARKTLLTSISVFVFYNLVNGMKGGIDNAAHIGGLVSGLVVGYCYHPTLTRPRVVKLQYAVVSILTIFVLATSFIVYQKIPNDIGIYDKRMQDFTKNEEAALALYQLPENTPREKMLAVIKDSGVYYWNENVALLKNLNKLKLPRPLYDRNARLIEYCDLRNKSYELMYKTVDEQTDKYKDSTEAINKQISALIDELKKK
jgi:rhomboid protease GluP